MLDDLRKSAADGFEEEEEETLMEAEEADLSGGTFLGMTAVERMLLSILMFLLVTAVGALLLIVTQRIVL